MNKTDLINKIIKKKEFSDLPKKDVLLAFKNFDEEIYSDEEKIKLTRNLLRKVFSSFISRKLLLPKSKNEEWFLKKHLSTRERFSSYEEVYSKILKGMDKKLSIIDLGAGVNGLSYNYFKKIGFDVNYFGVEAMGQFVNLMNNYFKSENLNGKAIHLSLFEINKLKKLIKKTKKPRVIFLLKTIDSLEMMQRDYSKKLILEVLPLCDRFVLSFSTKSMVKRKKFSARRNWIINFIESNFKVLDIFELEGEKYFIFENM